MAEEGLAHDEMQEHVDGEHLIGARMPTSPVATLLPTGLNPFEEGVDSGDFEHLRYLAQA